MGTTIKIEAWQYECDKKIWEKFVDKFIEKYGNNGRFKASSCEEFVNSGLIHCPYSHADLESQMEAFVEFKGSGIIFNLYFEEREPDEVETL
jgi:hypothetical protein